MTFYVYFLSQKVSIEKQHPLEKNTHPSIFHTIAPTKMPTIILVYSPSYTLKRLPGFDIQKGIEVYKKNKFIVQNKPSSMKKKALTTNCYQCF